MVVRLLNKIQNGDGEFPAGSVLEIDDAEATRLVKLKAAISLEDDDDDEEFEVHQLEDSDEEPITGLKEIPGIKEETIESLNDEGIYSVQDLAEKRVEDLILIKGIGVKTAERLIEAAEELLEEEEEEE